MRENIETLANRGDHEERATQKEILIAIAQESCELFHHEMTAYAQVKRGDHKETWPVQSRTFRLFLEQQYHERTGGSPSSNARTEALSTIEALARFEGQEHPVYRRVARLGNKIVIDLGDPGWRVIEVSDIGWCILSDSPVRFHRGKDTQALPVPEPGGRIDDLFSFINVKPEDRLLFLAWVIFSLMPDGPFTILVLRAFHGSGKTTTSRYILSLIDPRKGGLRAFPKDERDLAIAATNGWLMGFDNLSHVPPNISDALCRLTHGSGFATRTLYENTEETIIDAKRPILLNSISDIIDRPDLADRALLLELPPIDGPRKTEVQIEEWFQKMAPRLMGSILDLMVQTLRELPGVGYENLPRMADFARVGIAVERVLGYPEGSFLDTYSGKRAEQTANVLDHPVVAGVFNLLENSSPDGWFGTFKELRAALEEIASESDKRSPNWPKTEKGLGNLLRNLAPAIRSQGLETTFPGHSKKGSTLTIKKVRETRSPQSPQSPARTGAVPEGDRWGDRPKPEPSPQSPGDHGDHPENGQSPRQSPEISRTVATGERGDHGDRQNQSFLFEEVD